MKKHDLFKYCSAIGLALLCATHSWADYRLNNPIGPDGYYIVKWDCERDTWAESNDMEFDETFVLAVDLTGTIYENWVKNPQTNGGVTYPVENTIVSLNSFRSEKPEYVQRQPLAVMAYQRQYLRRDVQLRPV